MELEINQNRTTFSDKVRQNIQNLLSDKIGKEFVKYICMYYRKCKGTTYVFYKFNIDFKSSDYLYCPDTDSSEHHFGSEVDCEQFLEDCSNKYHITPLSQD
jgi:5-hydroxyisourate hydrolase-like protein (transthyretin family)